MSKGTVLIFAYECYPYNRLGSSIGAQRPYQFARNLAELGWKVIVLCCDHTQRRTLDPKELEQNVNTLFRTQHERIKEENFSIVALPSLTFHNWVDRIWFHSVEQGPGGTYVGKPFPYSIIRKVATVYNQLVYGDYSMSWKPVAERFTELLLKDSKVDVMIGEHSPDAGIVLADAFFRRYNIPWVADFRDPILWPFKGWFKTLYKPIVKKIVRSASATISVNSYWTSLDQLLFDKPAYTIVNGYDHELFASIPAHLFPAFTVSYFGSYNPQFQDIQPSLDAFAAWLKKNNYPSDGILFYRGLSDQEFLKYCEMAGIPAAHLDVKGYVERKETIAYMKGSAVLLIYAVALYKVKNIYEEKGLYPGKVFEYIGAGTPILAIPSDEGLLASLIHDQKKGRSTSSPEEAVLFLQEEYQKWKNNEPAKRSAATDIGLYSRQVQAAQLNLILTEIRDLKSEI
ncbi:MAG: hypothetical protein JWO58_1658 [Chitinophagaceae bacterium]|nr:hypothetical protein [Chitinophagaceae bacterium]